MGSSLWGPLKPQQSRRKPARSLGLDSWEDSHTHLMQGSNFFYFIGSPVLGFGSLHRHTITPQLVHTQLNFHNLIPSVTFLSLLLALCRNPDIPDSPLDIILFPSIAYVFPPFSPFPPGPFQEEAGHVPTSIHMPGPQHRLPFLPIGVSIPFVH